MADFGTSRVLDITSRKKKIRELTTNPGRLEYMPPEAECGNYHTPLDIFSFGHLFLFTLLQVFPDKLLPATFHDSANNDKLTPRSEVERRQKYFEKLKQILIIDDRVLCCSLIEECLHNGPEKRPTACQVLEKLNKNIVEKARMLDHNVCIASRDITKMEYELQTKKKQLKNKDDELRIKDLEIKQLKEQLKRFEIKRACTVGS